MIRNNTVRNVINFNQVQQGLYDVRDNFYTDDKDKKTFLKDMKKPSVLFILHLPPPTYGATIVGEYIRQSSVINEEFEADYINLATNKVLSQLGKGSLKKMITFARILQQVFMALRRKKYDLCYVTLTATGAAFYKDLAVVSVLKMFRKNIIYHFHNKGISASKSKFDDTLYRYAFKETKSILLSRYLYPDIKNYVSESNVYFCPGGIPAGRQIGIEKKETKPANAPCQLLFLSNMMREKGIFILLDACQILKEKNIFFECHFIGGWIDVTKEDFDALIQQKNLSDVVFAHGPKYNEEKLDWYRKADVFLFPTFYHYEAFPLVNLEAMQYSLPIVSTPEGGIPEIVIDGETGFLVPQQDVNALAGKLALLIENPLLRLKMGEAGRQRFNKCFTIEKFENNLTEILKKAITDV